MLAQATPPPARLITQEPPNPPGMTTAARPATANRIVRAASGTPGVDPGWNLVSLLRQPADPSPAAVFSSLSGSFARVFSYDACDAADPWKVYDPADPAGSDLTSVDIKKGLWIEATAGGTLPAFGSEPQAVTLHLCPGWNLIGFPAEEPRSVETVLAPIAGKYVRVVGFDITDSADPWEIYDVAVPGWANDLKLLQPGRGYWILATAEADLTILRKQAPVTVAITAPSDLGVVTAPADVLGTVTGDALQSWTLSYRAEGAADWIPLAAGTSAVTGGRLGAFDPTLLLNGPYELELAATDSLGEIHFADADINVEGQLKVGLFTLTFSDLEVGLAGLPIQVLRTYDSRDKTQGDFGIGWRLEIRQGSYTNNRKPGDGWQFGNRFLPCDAVGETRGHQTTIRLSDREIYRFKLAVFHGVPSQGGCFAQARFDFVDGPVPGATLDIQGNTQVLYQNGGNEVLDPNSFELYEPQQVRLTTRDGRIFDLDLHAGVTHLEDPNGNALSITPEGITHSSGRTVTFERDSAGRITRITDPENNSLVYTYDTAGDLVEVQDRETNPTKFTYDTKHLLLDIENALGVKAVRSEYDATGRLIKTTDAAGKAIEFAHDLAARREVVTDRLLHTRVFEYDERGNVIRETDANGKLTQRVFDADDHLLSETDPLGHTSRYAYDKGNLIEITDPLGHKTTQTYDAKGHLLTIRDPRGKVSENVYDERGNLVLSRDAAGGERQLAYDTAGNLITETDAEGGIARSTYDGFGNLLTRADALGHETTFTYDRNGNRLTQTTARTRADGTSETLTTTSHYDGLSQLLDTVHADGSTTATSYDPIGRVTGTTDALGRTTTFHYDALGRQAQIDFPDGTSEERTYDAEGRRLSFTNRAGRATTYTYDLVGRLIKTSLPDGTFTEGSFDDAGHLVAFTDARRSTTTFVYDDAGRHIRTVDALGGQSDIEYDAAGNQIAVTDPDRNTTHFELDDLNRVVRTVYADGSVSQASYDRLGRRTAETDQAGKTTRYGYDALGKLLTVTDALGQITRYTYDELGNRISQTDANQHTTRFEYDVMGRMRKRVLPDGSAEEMSYDTQGNLTQKKDFSGRNTTYEYDRANRIVRRTDTEGIITYTYTAAGRRETVTDSRGLTRYTYDLLNRMLEKTEPDGRKLAYAWDANGNRTELTAHVAGQVLTTRFTYDALNRLDQVTDPRGRVYDHGYDAAGNRTSLLYPNGVETTWSYDALNRLKDLTTRRTGVGDILQSYSYTLGPAGNRVRVDEQGGTHRDYTYDDLYRLAGEKVTATSGVLYEKTFSYDPVGNRLQQVHVDAAGTITTPYTYDTRDRLVTEGSRSSAWDTNGNLTAKTGQAAYSWDQQNRLRTVNLTDGTVVTHTYDADGVLQQTIATGSNGTVETKNLLVDTSEGLSQVIAETDAGGQLTAYYVRGDDLLALLRPTGDRYYHTDGLGSVRLLTSDTGDVTDRYTFTAFGELLSHQGSDPNAYLFAGEALDPNSGFYYLRARWMEPGTGRFASADLFAGSALQPLTLHKYLYVLARPADFTDPSGFGPNLPEINMGMLIQATVAVMNVISAVGNTVKAMEATTKLRRALDEGRIGDAVAYASIAFLHAVLAIVSVAGFLSGISTPPPSFGALAPALASGPGEVQAFWQVVAANPEVAGWVTTQVMPAVLGTWIVYSQSVNGAPGEDGDPFFELYKDQLRAEMERPSAEDAALNRILDKIYRENAQVGSGSTAAAVREELRTGEPVGGAFHSQKAQEMIGKLVDWLRKNPTARLGDRAAAENVLRDLVNALAGR